MSDPQSQAEQLAAELLPCMFDNGSQHCRDGKGSNDPEDWCPVCQLAPAVAAKLRELLEQLNHTLRSERDLKAERDLLRARIVELECADPGCTLPVDPVFSKYCIRHGAGGRD